MRANATHRMLRTIGVAFAFAGILACSGTEPESQVSFSEDELYLIEVYADIKSAGSVYRSDPARAETLFVRLEASVDTARVRRTMRALDANPTRWASVFTELETRLRDQQKQNSLERTRQNS